MTNLTHQQETLARAVVSGKNQSDAYREAYPNSLKWQDKTLWSRASEMMAEGKVAGRVKELRRPAVEAVEMSAIAHLARLANIRDAALQTGGHGPAVRAEMAIGQVAGHDVQQLEVKNDKFSRLESVGFEFGIMTGLKSRGPKPHRMAQVLPELHALARHLRSQKMTPA